MSGTRHKALEKALRQRIATGEVKVSVYQHAPYTCVVLDTLPGGVGFAKHNPNDQRIDGLAWSAERGETIALGRAVASASKEMQRRDAIAAAVRAGMDAMADALSEMTSRADNGR